jgi:hypothetical protein
MPGTLLHRGLLRHRLRRSKLVVACLGEHRLIMLRRSLPVMVAHMVLLAVWPSQKMLQRNYSIWMTEQWTGYSATILVFEMPTRQNRRCRLPKLPDNLPDNLVDLWLDPVDHLGPPQGHSHNQARRNLLPVGGRKPQCLADPVGLPLVSLRRGVHQHNPAWTPQLVGEALPPTQTTPQALLLRQAGLIRKCRMRQAQHLLQPRLQHHQTTQAMPGRRLDRYPKQEATLLRHRFRR